MSETTSKHRKDAASVILAIVVSLLLAGALGGGSIIWKQLDESKKNQNALANQVKALGGTPVVVPKAGATGDPGPQGPRGFQGPPGAQGKQGPIGITGRSPQCLLEPTRCVGPKGATGGQGVAGPKGSTGDTGPAGAKGDTGPAGHQGDQGPKGDQGIQGLTGPVGPVGPDTSAEKCEAAGGSQQQVTVQTSDIPPATVKILVCVLP